MNVPLGKAGAKLKMTGGGVKPEGIRRLSSSQVERVVFGGRGVAFSPLYTEEICNSYIEFQTLENYILINPYFCWEDQNRSAGSTKEEGL